MKKFKLLAFVLMFISIAAQGKAPVNLRVLPGTLSSNSAIIFWEFPEDYDSITRYDIYLNNTYIGQTNKNSYKFENLQAFSKYDICVAAVSHGKHYKSQIVEINTLPAPAIINIKKLGAKGDGKSLDTKIIQEAIDSCPQYGEVYFPDGEYLTGALFILRDNISIRLSKNAKLKAVNNLAHFPLVKTIYEGHNVSSFSSVLNIGKLDNDGHRYSNIRIYGGGTIDNQGSILAKQQTENLSRMARSKGLPIVNCDNVSIENITITNPCTWNVHPLLCNGFTTYECSIISSGFGLTNADGWDPDSSTDCYLLNSTLDGQDDNIAIKSVKYIDDKGNEIEQPSKNIYVSFCTFIQGGGLCIGVELPSGVQNVWITNCVVESCDRGIQICSRQENQGLGAIEDVHFRDILIKKTGEWGINITFWYWITNYMPGSFTSKDVREIKDIYFDNVTIEKTSGCPIQILGLEEQPIKNIHFNNVKIGGAQFEVLLRHCQNVSFKNVDVGERYWEYDDAQNIYIDKKTSKRTPLNYKYKLADPDATYGVKALFSNLIDVQKSGRFVFGAQDATSSGYGWNDLSGISDIERTTGKKPQIYAWDFMTIANPEADKYRDENTKVRNLTTQAFYNGGITTYCWHFSNPITGGSFYEVGDSVVKKILPGGPYHKRFTHMLDLIAEYNKTLIGKNGEQIPVIFRPWHEFNGSWFWWGQNYCTAEEFKNLYRFTVTYLRDSCGIHNFLYAFSPDVRFESEEDYLERYPGDEFVDVIALDDYADFRFEEPDVSKAHKRIKIISDYAKKKGKIAALSETGQNGLDDSDWFTNKLLKAIYGYPEDHIEIAYVAVWRNSVMGFWTPYKGHPALDDFKTFVNDDKVIMNDPYDWTNKFFHFDFTR